jgi:hypothetical protein
MVGIGIVLENSFPFDTAADDVMNGARRVYAGLSSHAGKLATGNTTWQDRRAITLVSSW